MIGFEFEPTLQSVVKALCVRFLNVRLQPDALGMSCLVPLMEAWFPNRCTVVLGHSRKSYFYQSKMAEAKVLQFVLLFPRGQ